MPNRDSYRNKAKACIEAIAALRDPTGRLAMLEVARGYMKLADHAAAQQERSTPGSEQDRPRQGKQELERFCSTLRSVLLGPDDRGS